MNLNRYNLVWFKKDLRIHDHRPLNIATQNAKVIGLFIIEDEWLKSPEYSDRHLQFAMDSLFELQNSLTPLGIPLIVRRGEALAVLQEICRERNIKNIYSHEETGLSWTFERDKKVRRWCKESSIHWHEFPQFSVIRGLKNRDHWNTKRNSIVARDPLERPRAQSNINIKSEIQTQDLELKFNPNIQSGGEQEADDCLKSFLTERGETYTRSMSTPVLAFEACSRISPHLAWGTLSLPQVHFELNKAKQKVKSKEWKQSLRSFESRLWWHCHFIQKMESEPEIEFRNMNRGFDGMRENEFDDSLFCAWKKGETGYPMVDACMRALISTGWINFRMRALVISFASYHLWLHWRKTAQYLAQLFTDFEPGIHFSQIQMQSGVTGINTIRMYSPLKQAQDNDRDAEFIKQYCPELESLPAKLAHDPSQLTVMEQTLYGVKLGSDYPLPIVDHKSVYKESRNKVYKWRNSEKVRKLAPLVYQKHGSRKNRFFPTQHRKAFGNLDRSNEK